VEIKKSVIGEGIGIIYGKRYSSCWNWDGDREKGKIIAWQTLGT
jgi:hypothetical protein